MTKLRKKLFFEYRKMTIPNYEERYKNLLALFYKRDFFEGFATNHDMDIVFENYPVTCYWNNEFVFNCYMYKK